MSTSHARGTVVVGADATPGTRPALAWCQAWQVVLRRLPLHVVLAVDALGLESGSAELPSSWTLWGPAMRAAHVSVLEEARDCAVGRRPGLTVIAELADGAPADALRARGPGSAMVVIGSRHHGIVRDLFSRESVGKPLVKHAPCPVAVVHEPQLVTHAPPRAVVGVDGSALSTQAVRFAVEEAAFRAARVIAVSAWQEKYPLAELRHAVIRGHRYGYSATRPGGRWSGGGEPRARWIPRTAARLGQSGSHAPCTMHPARSSSCPRRARGHTEPPPPSAARAR